MKFYKSFIAVLVLSAATATTVPGHTQSIVISNTTITTKTANANLGIGIVTVTGSLDEAKKYKLSLSGTDGAKFRLSTTVMPATLKIGPANLPTGNYNVSVVGTKP